MTTFWKPGPEKRTDRTALVAALVIGFFGLGAIPGHAPAEESPRLPPRTDFDAHYTQAGFFDIHVCNWPDRPLFFFTLFSSTRFAELKRVEMFLPNGRKLGEIGLTRYRLLQHKKKPDKRVFITHIPIPENAADGWYTARITLDDGTQHTARDYVIIQALPRASNLRPADGATGVPVPKTLSWDPVPGAQYYQVYIKDLWGGGQLIYRSKMLAEPRLELPADLLKPDGWYAWRIHARDANVHILLGDFNHGSLGNEVEFETAP